MNKNAAAGWICLILLILLAQNGFAQNTFPQPDIDKHRPFLHGNWESDRPSVLVFKDPFCPYCLKDLPKLKNIRDYNVFLFWSPILGPRSVDAVNTIFQCSEVVSQRILDKVQKRQPVQCEGGANSELKAVNDLMVAHYDINAVPAYYLQGKRVSRAYLEQPRKPLSRINGVSIHWPRYEVLESRDAASSSFMALVVPGEYSDRLDVLDKRFRPHYLVPVAALNDAWYSQRCRAGEQRFCDAAVAKTYKERLQEFVLLLGFERRLAEPLLITDGGAVKGISFYN